MPRRASVSLTRSQLGKTSTPPASRESVLPPAVLKPRKPRLRSTPAAADPGSYPKWEREFER